MTRRNFISLLGGAAVWWPLAANAQQRAIPVIGFLNSGLPGREQLFTAAFRRGLQETGYREGENVQVEYRWAENQYDRLTEFAAELVKRQVRVIVATGGSVSALAAKTATTTIPIVFQVGADPVKAGLVANLNRPGGNVTGITNVSAELGAKRLELLRDLAPRATLVAYFVNAANPNAELEIQGVQQAARALGLELHVMRVRAEHGLQALLASLSHKPVDVLLLGTDPLFNNQRDQLIGLAAQTSIPAIYAFREFVLAGGLMSYGTSFADAYRQAGIYAGRILNGESPADLPVMQPTKFELVINLKTARALGLEVPPTLLARADEVIE
jgi:putative ABC transport system substrate-binding protein